MLKKTVFFLLFIGLLSAQLCAAVSVGIYNPEKDGGTSCGETGIFEALKKMNDIAASFTTKLNDESLSRFNVLILPDVYKLGEGGKGWKESLPKFVRNGGGLLYSFHNPALPPESIFPGIVQGFQRHIVRTIKTIAPHPVTFMMVPFRTSYSDHRDITPGKDAQVLLRCADGEPVVIAGNAGSGRVVISGIVIGFPAVEAEPEGDELRLLRQTILWLARKDDLVEREAKRGILRAILPEWWLQPEQLPVTIRAFVPDKMRKGSASAVVSFTDSAGKLLASRNVRIALSEGQKTREVAAPEHRAGFTIVESKVSFDTRDLPDGDYRLRIEMQSPGAKAEESRTIKLRGVITAENNRRNAEVRKRISGMTIKFAFTQGFPIEKDVSTHLPFIRAIKEAGFDAYEFMPRGNWTEENFRIFEHFLKVAKDEDFSVWALLLPYPTDKSLSELPDKGRSYYIKTVERFGELASQYDNFIGYCFDDFMYYLGYFTPDFVGQMTEAGRAKCDSLIFSPLLYYPAITEEFFRDYGPYIDGIVFHFRAQSNPGSYIEGYDPFDFQDYAECMQTELRRIRELAGNEPVICGIYIWYTRAGWGVHYREGKRRFTEDDIRAGKASDKLFERHIVMDALQKICIAHEYADAIRVYGLGIKHPAYSVMGDMIRHWRERKVPWGFRVKVK